VTIVTVDGSARTGSGVIKEVMIMVKVKKVSEVIQRTFGTVREILMAVGTVVNGMIDRRHRVVLEDVENAEIRTVKEGTVVRHRVIGVVTDVLSTS